MCEIFKHKRLERIFRNNFLGKAGSEEVVWAGFAPRVISPLLPPHLHKGDPELV